MIDWILSNTTTSIFFGIILVVLIFALLRYLAPIIRRARAFRRAQETIEAERGEVFPEEPFPDRHGWLNDLWRQYAHARQDSSVEIEGEVVSPVDPESFFTRPQVLQNYNRRTAVALAGVFLALGILGTFWGLVLGLESVDTTTSEQLLASVNSLLSGMSTAFWSSIGGITVSIFWLLVDRWAFTRLREDVQQFFRVVHSRWPVTSADRAVYHDLALQVEHTTILRNLGTDLAQAFQQAIDASFSEKLSPALTSIDETLDRVASQVSDEQAEALDQMAVAFQERLLDSVEQQFEELAGVIQEATDWQRRVTDDVGSLFEQVTDLSQTNTRLLENSSQAAERFLASVDRLGESQERLAETSENLEEVARQTARLSQELEGQSQVFVDANEEIRQELAKQLDQVEEQVGTLADFWKEVHGDLERLSTSLSENLTEFTDLTEERLGQVFNRFDSEMGTVVEHLGGTLAELREVTEELGPTIQRVERALEETVEPISESRQEVSALAQSIQSLDGLPEHLGTASREMESARQALRDLSERIESLNGQLGDGAGSESASGGGGASETPREEEAPADPEDDQPEQDRPWWRGRGS